jgi:hypothetical protein
MKMIKVFSFFILFHPTQILSRTKSPSENVIKGSRGSSVEELIDQLTSSMNIGQPIYRRFSIFSFLVRSLSKENISGG